MTIHLGAVPAGSTIFVPFASYDSNGASVTLSGLATSDIKIVKNGTSERANTAGYALIDTDGIDIFSLTGLNMVSIDLSDNTVASFYAVGSFYTVFVSTVTIDTQTVGVLAATFFIRAAEATAGYPVVDVAKINNVAATSVTTINANVGTTQPINFTGTAGSALAKSDVVDIAGAAVSATTAQIGTNVVQVNTVATTPVTTIGANVGTTQPINFTGTGASALAKSDTVDIAGSAVSATTAQLGVNVVNWNNTVVATPATAGIPDINVKNINNVAAATPGAAGGVFIAGANAATSITTALTANIIGNITGNLSGSVGSVTGAVGSVTGAVGSVTGSVGSVTGAVGSVTGAVGSIGSGGITTASFAAGAIDAAAIAANAIGASELADGAITAATFATDALDATALATDAVNEITASVLGTALTETYAADGAAPTVAQALYLIQQLLGEFSIAGTTLTVKKLNGSTTAATFTLNDGTNPTAITRAS